MKVNNCRLSSVLLISFLLIYDGCTVYGLGIGALVDHRKPDKEIVNQEDYNTIGILSEITIYQKDRSLTKGRFIEITEEYLTLETNFGLENVNMEDIVTIEAKSKKNAMLIGLGIGFALDIAYVALLARSIAAEGN